MIISTKNHFDQGHPLSKNKVCYLLLLFAVLGGCGNKGDLYHPQDEVVSQTEKVSFQSINHETDV